MTTTEGQDRHSHRYKMKNRITKHARSIWNTVGQQLELVVNTSRVTSVALSDQIPHEVCRLAFILIQDEAVLEVLHSLGLETF